MSKAISVYSTIVCLCVTICFAITLGIFLKQMVTISFPSMMSTEPIEKPSNHYSQQLNHANNINNKNDQSDEQHAYETKIAAVKRKAIQSSINCLIILLVDGLIFVPHWRILVKNSLT